METQIEPVVILKSMDEVIQDRLEVIAQRNYERQRECLAQQRRQLELKKEFSYLLSKHLGEKYGVCIAAAWIYDNLKLDSGYCGEESHYYFWIQFEPEKVDGETVRGGLAMQRSLKPDDIQHSAYLIKWKGWRSRERQPKDALDDGNVFVDRCDTDDFVEALTFAKTSKR